MYITSLFSLPLQDPFLLSFNHKELQRRYQTYHVEQMRSLDIRSSLMSTVTYAAVLCKALQLHPAWSAGSWAWVGESESS